MSDIHAMCDQCGNRYKRIRTHWTTGNCKWPEITDKQFDICIGTLMGDGSVTKTGKRTPVLSVYNTNKKYLKLIENKFETFTTGVKDHIGAEEQANNFDGEVADYNDQYVIRIRHPKISELYNWYSTGEKKFDTEIEINKTIFKHWYVCDGHIENDKKIRITAINEQDRFNKITNMFSDEIPKPSSYTHQKLVWNIEESKEILNMLEPIDGFEYKWGKYNE